MIKTVPFQRDFLFTCIPAKNLQKPNSYVINESIMFFKNQREQITLAENEFSVKYKGGGILRSKDDEIKKLLPVFRELANIFRVNIEVDCPDGQIPVQEHKTEPETINFHIDSFSSRFRLVTAVNTSSIFGLIPAQPISIKVAVPARNIPPYQLPKTDLYSPEAQPIGYILGSHIFIYQHVLTSESWPKEDNLKLLKAISFWFLPRTINNAIPDHGSEIKSGLNALRSELGSIYMPSGPVKKEEFKKAFGILVNNLNSRTLERLEGKIGEIEEKLKKLSADYFDYFGQYVHSQTRLESAKTEMLSRDFGKEFEALLIMQSVETVRVVKDRFLMIKTGPISQIPIVDPSKETVGSYDIGEFITQIDTVSPHTLLSHSQIRFYQDGYTGPFRHIHISSGSEVCFGNASASDNIGLNPIIDGLMAKFNIVPLIHLILTFMKKEVNKPTKRDNWDNSIKPRPDNYANAEEREEEKNRFIKLVSAVSLKSSMGQLEKEVSDLRERAYSLHTEILVEESLLHDYLAMLEKLNDFLANKDDINKEADLLMNDPSIFGLFISDKELLACFYQPKADQPETNYLPEDFILKITVDSFPKLLIPSPKRSMQNIPLMDPYKFEKGEISKDDEAIISNLQLGRISNILETTKEKIAGGVFYPKAKNQDKKDVKDGQ